jgi:pyridoxal phosphate enzyme (YggS family)
MQNITNSVNKVRQKIADIALNCNRDPNSVTLLAVSKTKPPAAIRSAFHAGQRCFGENYLQEALAKMIALADLDIEWHFIGPLQSNKTQSVAENFAWVHSVDRLKTARRLNDQRPPNLPPLNVCLQVNIDKEESKSGIAPSELIDLAQHIVTLPNIRLRGLMTIPTRHQDPTKQRTPFVKLQLLLKQLQDMLPNYPGIDTLSMGMSRDMETAIAEGATIVRIGTDIFGARDKL